MWKLFDIGTYIYIVDVIDRIEFNIIDTTTQKKGKAETLNLNNTYDPLLGYNT